MKTKIKEITLFVIGLFLSFGIAIVILSFVNSKDEINEKYYEIEMKTMELDHQLIVDSLNSVIDSLDSTLKDVLSEVKAVDEFMDAVGFRESTDNYCAVNTYGYIGRYQFGISALVQTGVCETREEATKLRDEFMNSDNPTTVWSKVSQDKAMLTLMEYHKRSLKNYIKEYDGTYVNGVHITESGILAAAHLKGTGGVRQYFNSGINSKDGYGTTIESYIEEFAGYEV